MAKEDFYIRLGEKLKNARNSINMTQQDAAKKAGFTNYQTLLSIEKGTRPIKVCELSRLAKIYNYDINYFISDYWEKYQPSKVIWRSCSSSPKIKIFEQKFIKYCQTYHIFEQRLKINNSILFKPLDKEEKEEFDYRKARNLAIEYGRKLDLGGRPSFVLSKVLEENLGIKILFLDLRDVASGAATIGKFGPAILINSSDAPWRRNFDLAHEFFHILTWHLFDLNDVHCNIEQGEEDIVEKWANYFASTLILPEHLIKEEFERRLENNSISYSNCVAIAKEFAVSIDALLWRLVNLRLISREDVKKALESQELREKNKKMRLSERGEKPYFSDRYISLAFTCYQKGYISRSKLAEYLDVELAELSDFLLKKGYSEVEDFDIEVTNP